MKANNSLLNHRPGAAIQQRSRRSNNKQELPIITLLIILLCLVSGAMILFYNPALDTSQSDKRPHMMTKSNNAIPSINNQITAIINSSLTDNIITNHQPIMKNINNNRKKNKPQKQKGPVYDFHFVHIPKCGGTSMTAVLRQITCNIDRERNKDCCTNPGFCDFHAKRRCTAIKGCINHIPQRKWVYKYPKSITIMREPISRVISAFFYRGHSPNLDFFQVRPEFKEIKLGKRPKVTFDEYIEMPEYQNIQTRMLGADSFPYRNVTITQNIFNQAVNALNNFYFIGIQEAYELSVELLQRELGTKENIPAENERKNTNRKKSDIKSNQVLMNRAKFVNNYDILLYKLAVKRFCETLKRYPDLYNKLDKSKLSCEL